MRPKLKRGSSFRGLLSYVFNKEPNQDGLSKSPTLICTNMSSDEPSRLVKQFGAIKILRSDIKKPVWHGSLSLPPGENINLDKWDSVVRGFLSKMGINSDNHQFVAVRHHDAAHDHAHIVVNRVGIDGSVWLGKKDAALAVQSCKELERELGLVQTVWREKTKAKLFLDNDFPLTSNEGNMALRTGVKPPRMVIQSAIKSVLAEAKKGKLTTSEFIAKLAALDVRAVPNIASTGKMNGFSFENSGIPFAGSKLGPKFSWAKLQQQGVEYVQVRSAERFADTGRVASERRDVPENGGYSGPLSGGSRIENGAAGVPTPADRDLRETGESGGPASSTRENVESDFGQAFAQKQPSLDFGGGSRFGPVRSAVGNGVNAADQERKRREQLQRAAEQIERARESGDLGDPGSQEKLNARAKLSDRVRVARGNPEIHSRGSEPLPGHHGPDKDYRAARMVDPEPVFAGLGFELERESGAIALAFGGKPLFKLSTDEAGVWWAFDAGGQALGDLVAFIQQLLSLPVSMAAAVLNRGTAPAGSQDVAALVAEQGEDGQWYRERGG